MIEEPRAAFEGRDDASLGMEEYGKVLRSSSDRSRYSIYVTTIVTILICIANYNIQEQSWSRKRLAKWYSYARTPALTPKPPSQVANGDAELLVALRNEYVRQFVSRDVMTTSPIPGVSIDINDLGVVGGAALVLLMQIVVICVAREHENVYLALYKVRLIASREDSAHGNSRANLLYHSLAMGQVLSAPPTLARWEHHGPWHHFRLVFAAPVIVYAWVLYTDFRTREQGSIYGVNVWLLLIIECVLWLILLTMCIVATMQSRAMALRWEHAFLTVNPHREHVAQMSLWQWLALGHRADPALDLRKRVATCIVDFVRARPLATTTVIMPPFPYKESVNRISNSVAMEMSDDLVQIGETLARKKCKDQSLGDFVRLRRLIKPRSVFHEERWIVEGTWEFEYVPRTDRETA